MKKRDFLNLASVTLAAYLLPGAAVAQVSAPSTAPTTSLPLPGGQGRVQINGSGAGCSMAQQCWCFR